ncbi:cation diffusion facilitator family transporter [Streptomyces sp. SID3343]|uniref:cation diffusion facilitator family transporter n=1 Tax=Streptomyces sp. SID3343 TaxID=2690260 RepID=UPI00136D2099|nr:cation diffusion facilitator family transporter [Streptomyces sp. SID3343]MYW05105.1 cation diffusion facilitator family transporter [Streptomyces sp. SID3343]
MTPRHHEHAEPEDHVEHDPRPGTKTAHDKAHAHDHGSHGGHSHGVAADADRRYLTAALVLIGAFIVVEVTVGILAGSLALITDAGHMVTDAFAIGLALVAMRLAARPARGRWTYGFKRAEILSAQINGITFLVLAVWFVYEAVRRLINPPDVEGGLVIATAAVGIVVNVLAAWLISRANRSSLNVEGAYQHILNDLWAFIATLVSGVVVLSTGFARADAIASLVVAALMLKSGVTLVRESWRIFLEAAPEGIDPDAVGADLAAVDGVTEVHDLHIWTITSGFLALSAHVLVQPGDDCHRVRDRLEEHLQERYEITHTTLQVDHAEPATLAIGTVRAAHCADPHGATHTR